MIGSVKFTDNQLADMQHWSFERIHTHMGDYVRIPWWFRVDYDTNTYTAYSLSHNDLPAPLIGGLIRQKQQQEAEYAYKPSSKILYTPFGNIRNRVVPDTDDLIKAAEAFCNLNYDPDGPNWPIAKEGFIQGFLAALSSK